MYLGFYTTGRSNGRRRSDGLIVVLVYILDGGFVCRVDVSRLSTIYVSLAAVGKSEMTRTQVAP